MQMHLFHNLIVFSYSRGHLTHLDQEEGDAGSEAYEEEFCAADEEQALMIE